MSALALLLALPAAAQVSVRREGEGVAVRSPTYSAAIPPPPRGCGATGVEAVALLVLPRRRV
jgi:hypothetical protein